MIDQSGDGRSGRRPVPEESVSGAICVNLRNLWFQLQILICLIVLVPPSGAAAQEHMHDMGGGHGDADPMPPGMPMIPGLVGLTPPGATFLPGAGVDPSTLPEAQPGTVVRLGDGDTLDLTAALVRRTIRGRTFVMYGFNGQVPGPLLRVPQNATIMVRFHNRIDLPTTVHWHGVRLDNRFDGVPGVTQEPVAPGDSFTYRVHFPDAGIYWYHPHVREDIEQAMGLFGNMLVDCARGGLLLAGQS